MTILTTLSLVLGQFLASLKKCRVISKEILKKSVSGTATLRHKYLPLPCSIKTLSSPLTNPLTQTHSPPCSGASLISIPGSHLIASFPSEQEGPLTETRVRNTRKRCSKTETENGTEKFMLKIQYSGKSDNFPLESL